MKIELSLPCPASRRPFLQLVSMVESPKVKLSPPGPPTLELSFWIDSNKLAKSGVFLICVKNSLSWGCLSEGKIKWRVIFYGGCAKKTSCNGYYLLQEWAWGPPRLAWRTASARPASRTPVSLRLPLLWLWRLHEGAHTTCKEGGKN